MKILLAVDGSAFSDEAVREVAVRPWPDGTEVRVVSAVEPTYAPAAEPWGLPANYFEELDKISGAKALSAIDGAKGLLRERVGPPLKVSSASPRGSARRAILDEADAWGADLIVLGSHGHGFWNRLILGSVSQAVASHARCSVEIVRRPPEKGRR